jgi:NitT/TauT family transport system permease protein
MKFVKNILTENAFILSFILLWEFVARIGLVNPLFIPPFSKVVMAIVNLSVSGLFLNHVIISLGRALVGFLVAVSIAIPLGLIMGGWFRTVQLALDPLFSLAAQVNPFILFHVIILFVGIGEIAKTMIIAWICIWPILFNTRSGVRNVDAVLLKSALSFGLNRWTLFYKIILPATAPAIFTGLRLSAGYAFFLLIVTEMMGSNSGLGWFILYSQENYHIEWIFSGALVIALLGLAIDLILKYAEKKVIVWEDSAAN